MRMLLLFVVGALIACGGEAGTAAPAPAMDTNNAPESGSSDLGARFDGDRALLHLVQLVERGGRYPLAPQREAALAALEADLAAVADRVERQVIPLEQPGSEDDLELVNLLARTRPEARRRVLLATHWDTRGHADRDPDPARRSLPVPGANDGTSGVVTLIELLRALRSDPASLPDLGVDVALFDGEELVVEGDPPCCRGSRHFAETLLSTYPDGPPSAAIVIDMVGDRELTFRREASSDVRALWLVDLVWSAGRRLAPEVFLDEIQPAVLDDHSALLAAGIPSVLVVDLEYDAWHTLADTPERVSARSLETVGVVLLDVLGELARGER